jgi:hypothetical protein
VIPVVEEDLAMSSFPTTIPTRLRRQRQRFHMPTTIKGLGVLALAWALAGCAGDMAMRGTAEPTLGAVGVGASRGRVEAQLGQSITSSTDATGMSPGTDECGPGSSGD